MKPLTDEQIEKCSERMLSWLFHTGEYPSNVITFGRKGVEDISFIIQNLKHYKQRAEALDKVVESYIRIEKDMVDDYEEARLKNKQMWDKFESAKQRAEELEQENERLKKAMDDLQLINETIADESIKDIQQLEQQLNQAVEVMQKLRDMTPYALYHEMLDPVLQQLKERDNNGTR